MKEYSKRPRVIVAQLGARRRYAVARILENASLLRALYTDSSEMSNAGLLAGGLSKFVGAKGKIFRLANRRIAGVPDDKIFSTDAVLLSDIFHRLSFSTQETVENYKRRQDTLGRQMLRWGTKDANCIYTMHHGCLPFVRFGKSRGLRIVVDVFRHPELYKIIYEEQKKLPDWGTVTQNDIALDQDMWAEIAGLADILLCPSEWVAEGVRQQSPQHSHKIRIVPYGASIEFGNKVNVPVHGRFFFAGGDALGKGLNYLGDVANELSKEYDKIEIRVAGTIRPAVKGHPVCKNLNFLGKLNKAQMKKEFLQADAFVFPTLSEGFAGVVAEAFAAGCPVITTREAGVPMGADVAASMIPARDGAALKEMILKIYDNREFRQRCAQASLKIAKDLTISAWEERLVNVITDSFKE